MKIAILALASLLTLCVAAAAQEVARTVSPRLIREVKPFYPPAAVKAGIGGAVRLECVVLADGTVGDVHVLEGIEPSLDAEAIKALKQWTFAPGSKDGTAVPVSVKVEIAFSTLKGPRLGSPDVFKAGPGVTLPKVVHEARPEYTEDARRAGIQGTVLLDCVVLDDGTVGEVRVSKHLDPDLDAEAIRTLRQWRFTPGQKDGHAVPVQISVELTFSMR